MPRLFKTIIFVFVILFLSCSDSKEEISNEKITIAVTITPYKYLVEKIADDVFNVVCSIPEGATPHHYEPTPKLIRSVSSAEYYFKVGKFMEFEDVWLQKIKGVNSQLVVYNLSENIAYKNNDPHIWLSPVKLKTIAKNILLRLIDISPDHKELFTNNYNSFVDSVDVVLSNLKNSFSKIENQKKVLLVYHGSWEYFAEDFDFTQISIEKGSKSASAKEFREILNVVKESNVKVIFIDPQHSKQSAEVIAKDLKIIIDVINPLPYDLLNNFYEIENKILAYYK